MLEQVLMNPAVNARDAMPKGGLLEIVVQTLALRSVDLAGNSHRRVGEFVRLTVRDTGCGIPADLLPKIFGPFFTTKDVGKGIGLGLATVHGIVQQHEGWIEVESEVNVGTAFHIYFPRAQGRPTRTRVRPLWRRFRVDTKPFSWSRTKTRCGS